MTARRRAGGEAVELQQQLNRLRVELDQTRAWCASLEEQLAELRALLRLMGIGAR